MDELSRRTIVSIDNIQLISVGAFGRAVARHLKLYCPHLVEVAWTANESLDPSTWPTSDLQVIASWRIMPSLCNFLDEVSYASQRPLVPIIIESSTLRLGPIVFPGEGGCWHCWESRSRQHAKFQQERSVLWQFYEEHPDIGPGGFLEAYASIGAAQVGNVIQSSKILRQAAGQIWQLDLFTREVSTGYLTGVDGCPRCGLNRDLGTRTYAGIREELGYLWNND